MADNIERWLAGPVDGVPPLLQPVAHALLQAQKEIHAMLFSFPPDLIWTKPGELASVGFHLQHIRGVLDRLFTYARGEALSDEQLAYLKAEAEPGEKNPLAGMDEQIVLAIDQLKKTDSATLTDFRGVGRKQLPSTVIGLLMHAAEHTMRHTGQMIVTVSYVARTSELLLSGKTFRFDPDH